MGRATLFTFLFLVGCVHLQPVQGADGRINIKFCRNATQKEKRDFFARHNLTAVAQNIFGYDVAEWRGQTPRIIKPLFKAVDHCTGKNPPDEMLVRDFEVERKRLTRPVLVRRLAPKKIKKTPVLAKVSTPWVEALIQSEKAHKFLDEKGVALWANGIVFADEGINFSHPDIKPALKYGNDKKPIFWMAKGRRISDFEGGHCGFVACLAAGYRDGKGAEGVAAKNAYILPLMLRFGLHSGSFVSDLAIGLAHYMELEKKGEISFHVVNMSFTLGQDSRIVYAAMKHMKEKLFVVAGGNSGFDNIPKNIDEDKNWPASWELPNIITVIATDKDDNFAINVSNYGPTRVDIAAPGENVASCKDKDGYAIQSGTSFSTALVSGAVSLLYSINPFMDEESAKYALLLGATAKHNLMDRVRKGRRLDVYASARLVYDLMYGLYEK